MQHIMTDWEQQIDWAKLRKFRVERMVTVMKQKGIRAVLLAKLDTIRYATSFHSVDVYKRQLIWIFSESLKSLRGMVPMLSTPAMAF